ncbi:hypothetical protein KPY62_06120 [Psychrobacter sp. TAE2020]|uniref:hypothetical protein n=1 Tax=Psychrobacter sp. TAE2020 TaxID=2846762 RepID=UPI001C0F84E4|nr:hypothetical protein [Psychrobacter sp. TAE2020]MBU5616676.1 hypothetical protein [Psychrobacter sp. TAE2020]
MDNSKQPLPDEMSEIASHKSSDMDRDDQLVDLDDNMLHTIDNDEMIDDSTGFDNTQAGSGATQGLTPMHRQNIDESTIDNLLVQDSLDDSDYPDIIDIADREAAQRSNDDSDL